MGKYRLAKKFLISLSLVFLISCLSYIVLHNIDSYDIYEIEEKDLSKEKHEEITVKDLENQPDKMIEEWEHKLQILYEEYQKEKLLPALKTTEKIKVQPMITTPALAKRINEKAKKYIPVVKATSKPASSSTVSPPRKLRDSNSVPGTINVHIWESWCGSRVEDLKRNIHFPLYPSVRSNLSRFFTQWYETGFGERVLGYLHPPETGNYTFAVSCDDNCEVWLSASTDTKHIEMIASVGSFEDPANTNVADFKQFKSQISKQIFLQSSQKYYIEVLHKQAAFRDHMLLTWLAPSWPRIKSIGSKYISSFIDTELNTLDVNKYSEYIPVSKAQLNFALNLSSYVYTFNQTKHKFTSKSLFPESYPINYIESKHVNDVLPFVEYQPSYLVDFIPNRYEGTKLVHETAVYPNDNTELTHMFLYEDCEDSRRQDSHYKMLRPLPTYKLPLINRFDADRSFQTNYKFLFKSIPLRKIDHYAYIGKNNRESVLDIKRRNNFKNTLIKTMYLQKNKNFSNNGSFHFHNRKLLQSKVVNDTKIDKNDTKIIVSTNKTLLLIPSTPTVQYSHNNTSGFQYKSLSQYHPQMYNSSANQINVKSIPRSYYPNRKRFYSESIPMKIIQKFYFKDGKIPNVSLSNRYLYIRLYDIFGQSIYHLSQARERNSMWKYHTVRSTCKTDGNVMLSKKVAIGIVNKYMSSLCKKHKKKFQLERIVNIEENHDVLRGDRYLLELDLKVDGGNKTCRLSRYVYRDILTNKLHEPKDFQWNQTARVHVIVPVKNQGRWVQQFIDNMEKIYLETLDENLNIIIVDFSSSDIDIKRSLKKSRLVNYDIIDLDGPFQRALGLQAGLDKVKDSDDIIFTCDLHLEIPTQLINSIRKHTIKGKMAFAPIVHRLSCGYTPQLPYGLWEIEGYGLFAITKYDFDRIGGMNTKEFKTKWGGEDWELLDRTLAFGIEVERLRVPHFHHYYHSKKRMWAASKTSNQQLNI